MTEEDYLRRLFQAFNMEGTRTGRFYSHPEYGRAPVDPPVVERNPKVRHPQASTGLPLWTYRGVLTWVQDIPEPERAELFKHRIHGKGLHPLEAYGQ